MTLLRHEVIVVFECYALAAIPIATFMFVSGGVETSRMVRWWSRCALLVFLCAFMQDAIMYVV